MPTIIICRKEDLQDRYSELIRVTHNLRFWTKYWNIHHGHHARARKEHWEKKADEILNELGLTDHENMRAKLEVREL